MPISFATGFGLHWDLYGLWAVSVFLYVSNDDLLTLFFQGPAIALGIVAAIEGVFIYRTDWQKAVEAAQVRNSQG